MMRIYGIAGAAAKCSEETIAKMQHSICTVYMLQLAEHTLLLLDHGNAKTITGQIIRNLAEGTLVENGLGGDIFDMPHSAITWTKHTWLKNTLIGFEDSTMSISHTLPQLTLWKDYDVFLIERFMKAKQFSSSQMTILNEI